MRPWIPGDEHWFCYLVGTGTSTLELVGTSTSHFSQRARDTLFSTSAIPGTSQKTVEDRHRILHLIFWDNLCSLGRNHVHIHIFQFILMYFLKVYFIFFSNCVLDFFQSGIFPNCIFQSIFTKVYFLKPVFFLKVYPTLHQGVNIDLKMNIFAPTVVIFFHPW